MAVLFWCIYLLRLGVSHPRVEPLIAFSHILELNSGSQDCKTSHCEVLLPESPHDSSRVPCGISVQCFSPERSPSYPMELSSKKQRLKPFSLCPHDFSSRLRQISNRHRLLTLFLTSYKIGANNLANFCLNLFQRSCFSKYFSLAIVQFLKSFINSSSTCLANCSL